MRHHDYGIFLLQLHEKVLHNLAGDRVKRTRGLIREDVVRLHCKTSCQAKPLLLADRKPHGGTLQPVLHLVPQSDFSQIVLHDIRKLLFLRMHSVYSAAVGDIVKYGHRQRTRALRHETDASAQLYQVTVTGTDDILVPDHYLSVHLDIVHIVNQSVESLEQRALAASRRTDNAGNLVLRKHQVNVFENGSVVYRQIQMFDRQRVLVYVVCIHILHVVLGEMICYPTSSQAKYQHQYRKHECRCISPSRERVRHGYPVENRQRKSRSRRGQ